jgi:hypothetical protein
VGTFSATLNTNGATVVDASGSNLYVMPGLVEYHSHLQKDFGESQGRAWLSFGVTTVRSPGNTPYEAAEDKEANEAGVRPGPRVYASGWLFEWLRTYYKMGIALSSPPHLEMELQRAKDLDLDMVKSYVRLPDLQQKRMVEFAHGIGIPVATHEIYPAAFVGVDSTEHTGATSRRGYSPKTAFPPAARYSDSPPDSSTDSPIRCLLRTLPTSPNFHFLTGNCPTTPRPFPIRSPEPVRPPGPPSLQIPYPHTASSLPASPPRDLPGA